MKSLRFDGLLLACCALTLGACATGGSGDDEGTNISDGGAARPAVTYHKDGTVETGELKFATVEAFQTSEDFVQHGRRCALDRAPVASTRAASDCSFNRTSIKPEYEPDAVFTIPVVVHIIQKSDGTGAIDDSLINSQIDVLNEDFDALAGTPGAGGTAGRIRFVLASTDPAGNATTGIERITNNSYFADPGSGLSPMKSALRWDTSRYFNIYTNDANGALGYATFPSESAGTAQDGVVLLYTSVGRNAPQGGVYNLGRTATHEVGHYLGLFHTFQGGCGASANPYGSGDLVADTNAHPRPDFECTAGASSCGGGTKPIENYMNYTNDACMTRFSAEQANRMRCSIINYRMDLVSIDTGSNVAPNAAFTASVNGLAASFSDGSTDADGTIAARAWSFGDGATATTRNPSHTYAASGTYTVTLTVTDNAGATDSVSATVTATGGTMPGGGGLASGTPVPGLNGARNAELAYYIDVPAGATSLTVTTAGGTGDADLYVRRGSAPTTATNDGESEGTANAETVRITNPQAGRFYILVKGYAAFSGLTLTATVVTGGGGTGGGFESTQPNLSASTGQSTSFTLVVPAGATGLTFAITGGTGDADLYIRRGAAPTTTVYDFRPYLNGNNETVTIAAPQAGTYYINVRAYSTYAGVTLNVSYD